MSVIDEKKEKVLHLYLKGLTQRIIAKELQISSRDVSKIINNYHEKINPSQEKSYTSKAFKMYLEGKSPVDIVIELDISPSEAEKTYIDYLRLSNRHEITLLYEEFNDRVPLDSLCKILGEYTRDENGENSIKRIIDNKYILSRQEQEKHERDLEAKRDLEYKVSLEVEIQTLEDQLEKVRKRSISHW